MVGLFLNLSCPVWPELKWYFTVFLLNKAVFYAFTYFDVHKKIVLTSNFSQPLCCVLGLSNDLPALSPTHPLQSHGVVLENFISFLRSSAHSLPPTGSNIFYNLQPGPWGIFPGSPPRKTRTSASRGGAGKWSSWACSRRKEHKPHDWGIQKDGRGEWRHIEWAVWRGRGGERTPQPGSGQDHQGWPPPAKTQTRKRTWRRMKRVTWRALKRLSTLDLAGSFGSSILH